MSKIKLFDPKIGIEEQKMMNKILKSKFWASGAGVGYVKKFENEFKKYIKSDDCIAVNSGSSALNLAISLLDIKGKEVILPSLTFVSTAHAVIQNGGKPIFADVDENLCINPNEIENLLSAKTKLVLPVHFGGFPCDLNKIENICKRNSLYMIEDAAHAIGSSYNKKKIGSHGFAVCFSFHPVKNLAMPTGGMISLNSKNHVKLRSKLIEKRWCGITNRRDYTYDVKHLGWNCYMNEFSAGMGIIQLRKLEKMNRTRKNTAKRYNNELKCEKMAFDENCSYHLFWIKVKDRKKFMEKLKEKGIETGIHYRPIHTMSMYKSGIRLPITERIAKEIVTIPIHPNLTDDAIDKIIKNVNKFS